MSKYDYSPISEKEYEKLVSKSSYLTFYNSPERLSFITKRNRKTGLFKVTQNESDIALITYQVIPARSGSFVYFQHSPLFIDPRCAEDSSFWEEFKNFALTIGRKEQAVYVRLTPRVPNKKEIVADIMKAGYKRAPVQELDACVTRVITVPQFKEEYLRTDLSTSLDKSRKKNIKVTFSANALALEDFVSIYRTLSAKKQIDFVPVDYLKDELKIYQEKKQLLIASARDDKDTLYASAAIVIQGTAAWYYWAAITDQGKELGADVHLLTEVIKELDQRGITLLDLWGGSVSREISEKGLPHPWKLLDEFKQGFGATLVEYLPAIDLPVKAPQYLAAVFYQRALMTKRGYPYVPLSA